MDLRQVKKLQKQFGVDKLQKQIEDGSIWKFEGSAGRFAMDMLKSGVCFLGTKITYDYYGNKIPSRKEVKPQTTGSKELAINFWSEVEKGNYDHFEFLEETFLI